MCDSVTVCVCETIGTTSVLRLIRRTVTLVRMLPTLDLSLVLLFGVERSVTKNGTGPGCVVHTVGFPM